jgi:deazaflavin-dependent oxidoreductase (nitroreductase family)
MISGVLWSPWSGGASAGASTLAQMGLVQALAYEVPEPNAAQRAMWHVSSSRPGAWVFAKSGPHLDRFLLRLSNGQVTLARLVAGIPVITIVTTGARTGRTRTTPLLGVPFAGDLAVIGTRFGLKGTPGWYYNLRADPAIQVMYRDKSTAAVAREVQGEERQAIWEQARQIYGGYEAYARRIKDRQIHIMLLSMRVPPASGPG